MSNAASHTPVRRAAVIFVFVTVMLDMLAFGIIIPVFPHLVQQMTGGDIANAVRWTGIMGALFGLMQFVFSPVQGALSDRFGRRPVILASNLSLGLAFILMALAQVLPVLFIGRMISGIASASISERWAKGVILWLSFCGGRAESRNQTWSSFDCSRACSARIRWPMWTGSKVPPKMPIRMVSAL